MRRAAAFVFCLLLAASAVGQTLNISNYVTDFQQRPANISQVVITVSPTNGVTTNALLHPYFPILTRANTPTLTNGVFVLTNCTPGFVYNEAIVARGGNVTYNVLAPTNVASGSTIAAWSNLVATTNLAAGTVVVPGNLSAGAIITPDLFVSTLVATNIVVPTNVLSGLLVDFSLPESTVALTGNLNFGGITNALVSDYNRTLVHVEANGADRTVSFPASWGTNRTPTFGVVSNGSMSDFKFICQVGSFTNVEQTDYP